MVFADRIDAGRRLGERVASDAHARVDVVVALPRGGIPVATEVARRLRVPLDIQVVRKIGAPWQPELALGAVADGEDPEVVWEARTLTHAQVDDAEHALRVALAEARRRTAKLRPACPEVDVQGKRVLVVDDGIATGATARAAARMLRRRGAGAVMLGVPVAPPAQAEALRDDFERVIVLDEPDEFFAVGQAYRDFEQVSDQEAEAMLRAGRGGA